MAKKQETKKVEVKEPQIENVVEIPQVVEQPKARERIVPSNEWEINPSLFKIIVLSSST